jgi:hypothetical protein
MGEVYFFFLGHTRRDKPFFGEKWGILILGVTNEGKKINQELYITYY